MVSPRCSSYELAGVLEQGRTDVEKVTRLGRRCVRQVGWLLVSFDWIRNDRRIGITSG